MLSDKLNEVIRAADFAAPPPEGSCSSLSTGLREMLENMRYRGCVRIDAALVAERPDWPEA